MRENDLFEIIGDIDEDKIREAFSFESKRKKFVVLKRLSFVACFVLIVSISFSVSFEKNTPDPPIEESVTENHEKGSGETVSENLPESGKMEISSPVLADVNKNYESSKHESSLQYDSVQETEKIVTEDDSSADNFDYETDSNTGVGLGGGGGSSGSSSLRKEKFSLEYLNLLNERITKKTSKGELPFIVSSFVNENINKVEVFVTSMEKELIDSIKAIDSEGDAIEFKLYSETIDLQ